MFAFLCLFPNPALPIGANTGLQAGQVVAMLSLPLFLALGLPKRQALAALLLVLPVLLSAFLAVLTGRAISDEVAVKTLVSIMLVFVVLVPIGGIVSKRYTAPLLSGIAWAILLHTGVGLYQEYRFAQNEFPLLGLYQNPSFTSGILGDPETWAVWVKRPFGLFPEPSAMAASIGPWLVLMLGLLLSPRLRHGMKRGTTTLLIATVICGVSLVALAQSGYMITLLACLLMVGLPNLKRTVLRLPHPSSMLILVAFVLTGVAVVTLSLVHLSPRLNVEENSSWLARLGSLLWGLSYLGTSPSNLFFGVGPGQSYLILQSPGALSSLPPVGSTELAVTAVWSVAVNYVQEAGLVGALALALVLSLVLRAVVRSSARLIGLSCLVAWLVGIVLTTSYLPLLPLWLFLGVLLGWDHIFGSRATPDGPVPELDASYPRSVIRT